MLYVDTKIKDLIRKLDITICYDPNLDSDGRYIADFNFIALKSGLSEEQEFKALVHELGHTCDHHNCLDSYERALNGSRMERQANNFMLSETLEQYISINGLEPWQVNYINFLNDVGLDYSYIPIVQACLKSMSKQT
ncbi:ImmA/IrrE family metallo-endopeptidase [Lactobacillus sp. AN1001]